MDYLPENGFSTLILNLLTSHCFIQLMHQFCIFERPVRYCLIDAVLLQRCLELIIFLGQSLFLWDRWYPR